MQCIRYMCGHYIFLAYITVVKKDIHLRTIFIRFDRALRDPSLVSTGPTQGGRTGLPLVIISELHVLLLMVSFQTVNRLNSHSDKFESKNGHKGTCRNIGCYLDVDYVIQKLSGIWL